MRRSTASRSRSAGRPSEATIRARSSTDATLARTPSPSGSQRRCSAQVVVARRALRLSDELDLSGARLHGDDVLTLELSLVASERLPARQGRPEFEARSPARGARVAGFICGTMLIALVTSSVPCSTPASPPISTYARRWRMSAARIRREDRRRRWCSRRLPCDRGQRASASADPAATGFNQGVAGPPFLVVRYVPAMAPYPRIREQHIALFGESGSGKTVLASSFFGPSQEKASSNDLWDLVADDAGQGTRLYRNYLGMRDHATAPLPTRFAGATYYFSVKLKGGGDAKAKKRPFDILRLAWHDYPGNGSKSRRAARRRRTGVSTRSGPCCVPTSRSCWWMGRSCSTTRARRSGTSSRF